MKPEEVTILCSDSKSSLLPEGFVIGGLCTDRNNPVNKPFTFCTKASFEGIDFYSTNASTYIFINAGKEWQTLDIVLDVPQILGRQRLYANHFRNDATIYYKTKPEVINKEEFMQKQNEMEENSKRFWKSFRLLQLMRKICLSSYTVIRQRIKSLRMIILTFYRRTAVKLLGSII